MNRLFIGVSILLLIGVGINFLLGDSFYSKQSRLEVFWYSIFYSTENQLAAVQDVFKKEPKFVLEVPLRKQEHPVTCEVASLRMVLNYYGYSIPEEELIDKLYFDTVHPISSDGVWGDPERGFVGSVDGSIFDGTGYGVHDGPIRNLAKKYRNTVELVKPDLVKIIGLVKSGKPVIVWGLLSSRNIVSWHTPQGKKVDVYPGEHVRVVVGYTGKAENPDKLILLDPIYGEIRMSVEKFVKDWQMMNNRAVVVM